MKKNLLVLAAIALISMPVVMISCEEDSPLDCTQITKNILSTMSDYTGANDSNCRDYRDALQDYIDSDCGIEITRDSYQTILDGLPCN